MKRIKLNLTGIGEVLTKKAQEKLEVQADFEDLTCEAGITRKEYEDLGMKIPKDLLDKEKNFEKSITLEDEDFENLEYPVRIYEDEIVGYIRPDNETTIFTKTGLTFTVKETVEEIDELINNNN